MSRKIAIAVGMQAQADGNAPVTTREELERTDRRDDVGRPVPPVRLRRSLNTTTTTIDTARPTTTVDPTPETTMAIDLLNYTPLGDKKNSEFFESYLPKVYERRAASGLDELVKEMAAVVIQVEHGDAVKYLAELAVMGPYRLIDAALTDTHRVFLLRSQPEFPA